VVVSIPLFIAQATAGLIISGIASSLLKKKQKNPIVDEKPNSPSTRGAYAPVLLGRRRIGPLIAWVGDRTTVPESPAGGKGSTGNGSLQLVYRENAHHILCVGPGHALHRIWINGKTVYAPVGGITPLSHPSGSQIDLVGVGQFRIYWGEVNSPVDSFMGAGTRMQIQSRWKFLVRVVWIGCRLGGFPTWPAIEYEIQVKPYKPGDTISVDYDSLPERLNGSEGWLDNEFGSPGTVFNILDGFTFEESIPRGNIKIAGNQTSAFPLGARARVLGQPYPGYSNKYLNVTSSAHNAAEVRFIPTGYNVGDAPAPVTRIFNSEWVRQNTTVTSSGPAAPSGGLPSDGILHTGSAPHTVTWNGAHGNVNGTFLLNRYRNKFVFFVYFFGAFGFRDITVGILPFLGATTHSHTVRIEWIDGVIRLTNSNGLKSSWSQVDANWRRFELVYVAEHGTTPSLNNYNISVVIDTSNTDFGTEMYFSIGTFHKDSGTPVVGVTTVAFAEQIQAIDDAIGTLTNFLPGFGPGGPNAAHVLDQLMFETFPHGAGLDRSLFDITSLEEVGADLEAEGLRTHVYGPDGDEFEGIIATIFQDVGLFCSWDRVTGKFVFVLIREPVGTVPTIPEQLISDPKPERFSQREDTTNDKAIFGFPDSAIGYRDNIVVDFDDGLASLDQNQKGDIVQLRTVIDADMAVQIAERRSAEILTPLDKSTVTVLRDAGDFYPGQRVSVHDFDSIQRILESKVDPKTRKVVHDILTDNYAITPSTQNLGVVLIPPESPEPLADPSVKIVELPEELRLASRRAISILRIRAAEHIGPAAVYLSGDDLTYTQVSGGIKHVTGGTLFDAFAASAADIADGPVFYGLGPDVAALSQSLTDANRDLGRQLLIVNDEIMFIKEVAPLGENMYQLKGVRRAKYGTSAPAHAIGDMVYIVDPKRLDAIYDPSVQALDTIYVKTQPRTSSRAISLSLVTPVDRIISATPPTPVTEFFAETPTGAINGSNAVFVLVNAPNPPESLIMVKNGIDQREGVGDDYTISGNTITFEAGNVPQTGDSLVARRYLSL